MKSEERFKQLLRELFQSERADLDFGIYRVMNQKREALEKFIENGIVDRVEAALKDATTGAASATGKADKKRQEVLDWLKLSIGDNFDDKGELKPDATGTPFAKAWQILQGDSLHMPKPDEEMRKDVYNNLYTFFARYYDDGDFMCKQRYSANGRYAVPYNGEETLLHWANKDQYYIKTAEYFLRYEFKLPNGKLVRFEMREAELESDNNKGEKTKYFVPLTDKFGKEKNGCYVLPFEYRALKDEEEEQYGKKNGMQKNIIAAAEEALKGNATAAPLLAPPPQKDEGKPQKNGDEHKTLLSLQMEKYFKLNTADFFIHKNLGKFLCDELDYYINKELLVAAEQLRNNANSRARAAVAQATKAAGEVVIDFLAQLENYQKAIWEKKKFVVGTDYIIILREVKCDILRDIIAKNDAQWQEWKDLNFITAKDKGKPRLDFMREKPTLPVDTKHFNAEFKRQWLATVEDLDDKTDGVLFHGENWQALNLLQEKYRGKVQCVYIDPPYNTNSKDFLYKNNYKHSSWLSFIENRQEIAKGLFSGNGVSIVAIDDIELRNLIALLDLIYDRENYVSVITTLCNPQGRVANMVSKISEYHIVHAVNKAALAELKVEKIGDYSDDYENLKRTGTNSRRHQRALRFYPILHKDGVLSMIADDEYQKIYDPSKKVFDDDFVDQLTKKYQARGYTVIFPVGRKKDNGQKVWYVWQREFKRVKSEISTYILDKGKVKTPSFVEEVPKTYWVDGQFSNPEYGSEYAKKILGFDVYQNTVKSIHTVERMCSMNNADLILDYFAGSGTTAHAVINLNRKDDGKRKFILAEMGEYFHTVLVPRVKKIAFTPEWKEGKYARVATTEEAERAPRIVKYHRLESYEDALENIRSDEPKNKSGFLKYPNSPDYAPRYMLQAESGKSPTFAGDSKAFQKPFNYTLQKYNAGKEPAVADLPETFAYLIGLQEKTRQFVANGKTEYVIQRGKMEGKETVVLWRSTENWKEADYQKEVAFVDEEGLTANAEQIFINDESRIKGAASLTPIFAAKMFPRNEE